MCARGTCYLRGRWHLLELKKLIELLVCPPWAQLLFLVKNRIQGFSLHVREAQAGSKFKEWF